MTTAAATRIPFANSYARLPQNFHARVNPAQVPAPRVIKLNTELATYLNIELGDDAADVFAGNRIAPGSEPIALAYAGHQYAHFVPQLGDGRANLLGEVIARDGKRFDIQLKGSGRTPFSRRGDGKAALGPVLREYLVSEAMHRLGVPTTRALAAVLTGEAVFREEALPGAIVTRVASSHMRVGTFQYFAAQEDIESIRTLANYAIQRHYPDAASQPKPFRALLDGVISRQATLVAQWLLLGFAHGVMNTDNTSISGETIDYGPCAFLEAYDPATSFSSIDHNNRYAYANQPSIMLWNLSRLAESLLPLLKEEEGSQEAAIGAAHEALSAFATQFHAAHLAGLRAKLGLFTEHEGDSDLANNLLLRMSANRADFTLTFRHLSDAAENLEADAALETLFPNPESVGQAHYKPFYDWIARWRERLAIESITPQDRAARMRKANPIYIPRNHLVQQVIEAAILRQDFQPFEDLLAVTATPYEERPGLEHYARPARPEEQVFQTFCGT